MFSLNKRGQAAGKFTQGLVILIIAAVAILGIFGALFGLNFDIGIAFFVILMGLVAFGLFRAAVQSGPGRTNLEDVLFIAALIGIPIWLFVQFGNVLIPFSAFSPFASATNDLGSTEVAGIPLSVVLLGGIVLILANKKVRNKFARVRLRL